MVSRLYWLLWFLSVVLVSALARQHGITALTISCLLGIAIALKEIIKLFKP